MLAVLSEVPCDPEQYSFEIKWDGVRAIGYWDGRHLTLESRNLLDITARYPELHRLGDALGPRRVVLDGEIVALDEMDRPSFARLQRRMHVGDPRAVFRLTGEVPVYYIIFDLLYVDGRSLMDEPFARRREMLEELTLVGPSWRVPPAVPGEGEAMLEAARAQELEGIVAKRLDSIYEPGRRSPAWLKIKLVQRQELVIGGWTVEKTGNTRRIGSLLLGYFDERGQLRYAGGVGTGFTDRLHGDVLAKLRPLVQAQSPFLEKVPKAGAVFVKPALVAEIEYRRWPIGGLVQQGAFKGLRTDKDARDVVKEERLCATTASAAAKGDVKRSEN